MSISLALYYRAGYILICEAADTASEEDRQMIRPVFVGSDGTRILTVAGIDFRAASIDRLRAVAVGNTQKSTMDGHLIDAGLLTWAPPGRVRIAKLGYEAIHAFEVEVEPWEVRS